MNKRFKLLAILAHPDDESLGFGGTLAKYGAEGGETYLVTATRGERGRFGSLGKGGDLVEVGRVREAELLAAAAVLGIREVSILGYREMIQGDIALARYLYDLAVDHPELEAITLHLSITTLRYAPQELRARLGSEQTEEYLNELNRHLLEAIEKSGEAFVSNAVIAGKYALRFCIVNFRTSAEDIEAMPQLVARLGRQLHTELASSIAKIIESVPQKR